MEGHESIKEKDWKQLKDEAALKANQLVGEVVNYETMSDSEKIAALHLLLHSLAEDNSNRFIAEKIAVKLSILIEKNRYKKRMSDLQK